MQQQLQCDTKEDVPLVPPPQSPTCSVYLPNHTYPSNHHSQHHDTASKRIRSALDLTSKAASILNIPWAPHRWMTDIAPFIAPRRLTQVRMVGSHDAGTHNISSSSPFGPDAAGMLRERNGGMLSRVVQWAAKPITHGWAKTQGLSVLQQLLIGSRYLDVRVAPNCYDEDRFYITHSLMSLPFSDVVWDLCSFFSGDFGDNHKDVVILDVQHIFGIDLSDEAACKRFFDLLKPLEHLFFPSTLGADSTLEAIWSTPHRILCCVGSATAYAPAYVHRRPLVLCSPWHNCNSAQLLMGKLLGELQSDLGRVHASPVVSPTTTETTHLFPPSPPSVTPQSDDGGGLGPTPSCSRHMNDAMLSPHGRRPLYVTQAVMSPFVSDIVRGVVCSLVCGMPTTIQEYAFQINTIALRWFRDVNLCPASRQDILAEAVQALGEEAGSGLGLSWDDNVTNIHANILLLDYVEEGTCEWFFASPSGSDPTGRCRSVQRAPVATRRRSRGWSAAAPSSTKIRLTTSLKRTVDAASAEASVSVNAVHLCVLINLILAEGAGDDAISPRNISDVQLSVSPLEEDGLTGMPDTGTHGVPP